MNNVNQARIATRRLGGKHQRGLTLIEVLVAIVLLGVGLLGLAGLQLRGMQVNQGSNYRSEAAILAADLADRMRADAAGAVTGIYNATWLATTPAGPAAAVPANLLTDWYARLGALPSGCAVVDVVPPAVTRIMVTWDDSRAINASTPGAKPTAAAALPGPGCVGNNAQYVFMTALTD